MKKNFGPSLNRGSTVTNLSNITENCYATFKASFTLVCKTKILAYSSTREHSNKSSGARLKTKSEMGRDALRACEASALRACETLMPLLTGDFEEKKPTVFICSQRLHVTSILYLLKNLTGQFFRKEPFNILNRFTLDWPAKLRCYFC